MGGDGVAGHLGAFVPDAVVRPVIDRMRQRKGSE